MNPNGRKVIELINRFHGLGVIENSWDVFVWVFWLFIRWTHFLSLAEHIIYAQDIDVISKAGFILVAFPIGECIALWARDTSPKVGMGILVLAGLMSFWILQLSGVSIYLINILQGGIIMACLVLLSGLITFLAMKD